MKLLEGIQKNVLTLGFTSFLNDVSSEMIFPLLPLFLSTVLGAGKEVIGLIEGTADSITSLLDIFFGYFADKTKSRKKFATAGYGLSSVCKIGFALATTWPMIFFARAIERLGKSIRSSPRDAIIASSTEDKYRGKAFGLHRAMDSAGAVLGPILAYIILFFLGNGEPGFRAVFYLALIPAFLAVLAIWIFVKEPKTFKKIPAKKLLPFWQALHSFPESLKKFMGVSILFSISYFSFAFLILRANELGMPPDQILLLYILYNISYMIFSMPVGMLSDKIGRKPVIFASFVLYALICIGFIFATSPLEIAALFVIYGIFVCTDESVNKAYVSSFTPDSSRATTLGAYNSAVGAAYLPANALFGFVWASLGATLAFSTAAAIAILAAIGLYSYSK